MVRWEKLILIGLLLLAPSFAHAQEMQQHYELGGLITYSFLREIGSTDHGIGTEVGGFGARFVYRRFRLFDIESEVNFLPGNSATSGNHLQGLFGVKAGKRWERGGVFLKARAGFMHFDRDPFGVTKSGGNFFSHERAASTEPNFDLGGVVEFYTSRGLILRFDLGDNVIRYARRTVRTSDFVPSFEAGGFTTHNWQGSFGVGFRF